MRTSLRLFPALLGFFIAVFWAPALSSAAAQAGKSQAGKKPKTEPGKITKADENSPEARYFQLLLERQRLAISSYKHMLFILDYYRGDPWLARKDLLRHERERREKVEELFQKYGVSPQEYYRSARGTKEQKARAAYLDRHPEIRDRLAENSKEIRRLETEFWNRMRPLWSSP